MRLSVCVEIHFNLVIAAVCHRCRRLTSSPMAKRAMSDDRSGIVDSKSKLLSRRFLTIRRCESHRARDPPATSKLVDRLCRWPFPTEEIDVGIRFYSCAKMVVVGFYNYWLNDIDYIRQSHRKEVYKNYKFPLAVPIIITGMYEDDLNNADDVVYTGRGGHNLYGNKPQIENQVLLRGNLELKA